MDEELAKFVQELAVETRHERARNSRQSAQWQRQLAYDEARFSGLLIDVNERDSTVSLTISSGRQLNGTISEIGTNFIAITGPQQTPTFIRLESIASLELDGRAHELGAPSVRPLEGERSFDAVISELADSATVVRFATSNNKDLRSATLVSAGSDIVTLELSTNPPRTLFVATEHLSEITTA